MHSHSSAYQPVPGAEAYSHPLPGGSGALVIEIFSLRAESAGARQCRAPAFVCFSLFRSSIAQVGAAQDLVARRRDARKLYAHDPGGKRREARRHFAAHGRQIRLRIIQQRCMRQPHFV